MNIVSIPEEIKSEFSIDEDGKAFASRSATARLCGLKSHESIRNLLKNIAANKSLSKPLQSFAGQDFQARQNLPDILVAAIVTHYAWKGREEAQSVALIFQAIGIRTWIQQELNWQSTPTEIIPVRDISDFEALKLNLRMDSLNDIVRSFVDGCSTGRLDQLEKRLNSEISDRQQETKQLKNQIERLALNNYTLKSKFDELFAKYEELQQNYAEILRQKEYRQKLNQLVAQFGGNNDGYRKAVWNKLYGELIASTGFEVYAAAKLWRCSCLDAVETQGLMERLYYIASEFLVSWLYVSA